MMPPIDTLLKFDSAVLVSTKEDKPPKTRPSKGKSQRPSDTAAATTQKAPPETSQQQTDNILDQILPPREWTENGQHWMQKVSSAPSTRLEVVQLEDQLNRRLEQQNARETGICPIRRQLYSQCFEELIRQITINCSERGFLLLRVRDEIVMTIDAHKTLYESSVAFGMRKALQAKQENSDMEKKILDLENETAELQKRVNNKKDECEKAGIKEKEQQHLEEKKRAEEIQLLTRTVQQLKAQLEDIIANY